MPQYRYQQPPKEALDWFRAKGFATGFDYRDVWKQEHAQAFTVAKAMRMDVLTSIREALDEALENGQTFQQFKKELTPTLQKLGWWGKSDLIDPITGEARIVQLGSPRRLKIIYRTNMATARDAGRWERIERSKSTHPYLLYELGASKEHRLEHTRWHKLCLPVDHPFWQTHYPRNGWGCKCRVRQISQREYDRLQGKVNTQAPPQNLREWVNERTGEVEQIPQGIDPGFNYNAGLTRGTAMQKQVKSREKALQKTLAKPVPEPNVPIFPEGDNVLSTVSNIGQRDIAQVLNRIPDAEPQLEKLQAFLAAHPIKTLMIRNEEMGKSRQAWAIYPQVKQFLKGTIPDAWIRSSYYITKQSRANGFTSRSYEHIVIKVKKGDNLGKIDAQAIHQAVETAIAASGQKATRQWSLRSVADRLSSTRQSSVVSTWMHELGHQVHFWAGTPSAPRLGKRITAYSGTNNVEWHAEHFVAWLTNYKALKQWSPEIAQHFDDMIEAATNRNSKR